MVHLKKLCNVKANSLLESVVALSIISVCLYIAILVYASIFSPKTSIKKYSSQNKIYEAFFISQVDQDSLLDKYLNDQWVIDEEIENNLKKITVKYKDSLQSYQAKQFYINAN